MLQFGFNFRFDDIRAALGQAQLKKLPLLNRKRLERTQRYNERLLSEAKASLVLPFAGLPECKEPSYHIYPIVLPDSQSRDAIAAALKASGIQTSIHAPSAPLRNKTIH